ncbi:hypothetical protein NA56DRAFT_649155 [Hyaloscypha hepaticicola]|uniref:Extracellular membrane protein CFEM domain-containing protein n=1 Tax=Hyaloscypha hepaticicola TaxID=2082293 RepID=A0A2J6PS88_9HELO|nr:hypothetical protein NA56DRAFT_649155 [Hyaloscypha hepaticicola]
MKSFFLLLSLPLLALAQSDTPACVASCEKTSPAASFCDGTETGSALASCECQSLIGSNLVTCIKTCPSSQISWFASQQPALCQDMLFPGVSVSAAATSTAAGSGSSNTATTAATTSGTTTPSSSSSATPSQSAKAGGGTGAAGKNMVLDISLATAVMGGVFALLML